MSELAKYRIIFAGSPDFAVPSLAALVESGHEVLAVISQADKPVGRKQEMKATPVKEFALDHGIKVYTPDSLMDLEFIAALEAEQVDFLVTAAYGKIMPQWILSLPRQMALNVHASLLPKYRGAAPIQAAILNGDRQAGVSIMQMVLDLDAGPVYWQEKIDLDPAETGGSLFEKLACLGAKALVRSLANWSDLRPSDQKLSQVSYCPKLSRESGRVDWTRPAQEIERMIRAYYPWPTAYCLLEGQRFKIWSAELITEQTSEGLDLWKTEYSSDQTELANQPGLVMIHRGQMYVACGQGLLRLEEVQRAGQKRIKAEEMAHNLKTGLRLE